MAAIIDLQKIVKTYRLGETVITALKDLSFSMESGEFTALVGSSGSGKSTLLNLVGCIDRPDSGSIFLKGKSVTELSDEELAELRSKNIGFVFQNFNLMPVLNVWENVLLPLTLHNEISDSEKAERVRKSLRDVGLEDFTLNKPDQLSGGQRQRVAIARALVTRPQVVLADEPTANLDSGTAHKIIDLLEKLNSEQGVTFLFSTHDEKLIGRVSKVRRIVDGVIH
jgi:putative ABC transport system ATP-binding protein